MGSVKRFAALVAVIVFGVLILCMLLAFAMNGMAITPRILSDYVFICSMLVSLMGAMAIVLSFSFLKMKLRKNPTVAKLEPDGKNKPIWKALLISGIVLFLISYAIALI